MKNDAYHRVCVYIYFIIYHCDILLSPPIFSSMSQGEYRLDTSAAVLLLYYIVVIILYTRPAASIVIAIDIKYTNYKKTTFTQLGIIIFLRICCTRRLMRRYKNIYCRKRNRIILYLHNNMWILYTTDILSYCMCMFAI